MRPSLVWRAQRLALEVDDPEAIRRDEDLSEVIVAVRSDDLRRYRQGIDDRDRLGDLWREIADDRPGLAGRHVQGGGEMLVCCGRPATHVVSGRLSRRHLRKTVALADRRVKPGGQRAEVRGDLSSVLQVHLARCEQPARQ